MPSYRLRPLARVVASAISLATVFVADTSSPVQAQPGAASQVAVSASSASVARGGKGMVSVTVKMQEGWHVYAAVPGADSYIPTTVTATPDAGVTVGKPVFPKAMLMKTKDDPKGVNVYEGKAVISLPVTVAKTAKPGKHTVKVEVGYQTCNDKMCLPPTTVPVMASVTVK